MVYVTHDQTEAMSMADQVILLHDGRVEQDGRPEDLYNRPATTFTARFIGTPPMNVLSLPGHARAGQLLGVRPEDIRIVGAGLDAVVEGARQRTLGRGVRPASERQGRGPGHARVAVAEE